MTFTRYDADAARPLPAGSFSYSGFANDNIELIQSWQLKDASLWARLVEQFRNGLDNDRRRWRSEYWGKLMRGAAMTYAYTLDDGLYKILEETVYDLLSTQDELGRITSYDLEHEFSGWDIWGRKYVLLGLQHFMEISRDEELSEKITRAMMAHADYIIEKVGRGISQIPLDDTSSHWLAMNSHSILEPMVRLYNLTGEKRYLDFSSYIVENGGVGGEGNDIFRLALEGELYPYQYPTDKAYEMMSCFEGLLEYARATGEEKWFSAVLRFADKLIESDITLIGCAGCSHEQLDNSRYTQTDYTKDGLMQETCVTVTFMKLCYQLLRLTGDPKYADQIEIASYNALLGAVNTEKCTTNSGFHFDSYSPLILNTRGRFNGGFLPLDSLEAPSYPEGTQFFGCCTAISAAGLALMPTYSVMSTDRGIIINEYFAGSFDFEVNSGDRIRITSVTEYPYGDKVTLSVSTDKAVRFELRARVPAWSKTASASVCGEAVISDGRSFVIDREWRDGDTLELCFDMRPRVILPEGEDNVGSGKLMAIAAGPIVLARDARLGGDISLPVEIKTDGNGYVTNITRSAHTDFSTQLCYELDSFGEKIKLIDYASAGKTWDERSLMTAWLPIKDLK